MLPTRTCCFQAYFRVFSDLPSNLQRNQWINAAILLLTKKFLDISWICDVLFCTQTQSEVSKLQCSLFSCGRYSHAAIAPFLSSSEENISAGCLCLESKNWNWFELKWFLIKQHKSLWLVVCLVKLDQRKARMAFGFVFGAHAEWRSPGRSVVFWPQAAVAYFLLHSKGLIYLHVQILFSVPSLDV